ncbi:MAG: recombinase family protein [Anaerostipes hadrus]
MFDRYVAGAGSTMIARELNEQGIPTIKEIHGPLPV